MERALLLCCCPCSSWKKKTIFYKDAALSFRNLLVLSKRSKKQLRSIGLSQSSHKIVAPYFLIIFLPFFFDTLLRSLNAPQFRAILRSRTGALLDAGASLRSNFSMRRLHCHVCIGSAIFCHTRTLELAKNHGVLEFIPFYLFLDWHGSNTASARAQPNDHVAPRQPLHGSATDVR